MCAWHMYVGGCSEFTLFPSNNIEVIYSTTLESSQPSSGTTIRPVGTVATFSCQNPMFQLHGEDTAHCVSGGNWVSEEQPLCTGENFCLHGILARNYFMYINSYNRKIVQEAVLNCMRRLKKI